MTRSIQHAHPPQPTHTNPSLRASTDGKPSPIVSNQDASVSKSVPNGNQVPERNFGNELMAMLDADTGDQQEPNSPPVPDMTSQGAQQPAAADQDKGTDNQPANPLTTPTISSKIGGPTTPAVDAKPQLAVAEISNQAAALQAAPQPLIGLLQMIARPTVPAVNLKTAAQGKSSSSTQSAGNKTSGSVGGDSVVKSEALGTASLAMPTFQTSSIGNGLPQMLDNSSAETSSLTSAMPPLADSQSAITNPSLPSATDPLQISGQAISANTAHSYDAFTIELRSKSSASDGLNSSSAVSIANSRSMSQDSASASNTPTQNESSNSTSSSIGRSPGDPVSDIAPQNTTRVQSGDIFSAIKPGQQGFQHPLQNTVQSRITETSLAEKIQPQETGQMEALPVSASAPAVKSQIALSEAAPIPDKRKSVDEQGSADSHRDASQITDTRGMAFTDWKTNTQVRSLISEKSQSSAPVQPNDTQEQVPGGLVKQIVLKVEDPSGQNVSVRLTDRGSQVTLGVRSSDSAISAALKQDLPSLVGNLDRAGWRVDSMPAVHITGHEVVQTTVAQQSTDDQQSKGRSAPDWNDNQQSKKRPTAELWEEVLNRQSSY